MQTTADFIVVGAGLTGATIARQLADAGREVMVLDRRPQIGGNVHDETHAASGIRTNKYGPHYFRTSSEQIWEFVNRFSAFHPYEAQLLSWVDEQYEHWPVTAGYINRVAGPRWTPEFQGTPRNFEEASLAMMPEIIYRKFVKGYTEKQWGVPATQLAASLAKRFDVRSDNETRLSRHKYQGVPVHGYAAMMKHLLDGIPVQLSCDYLRVREEYNHRRLLIFTGPIDEFFGFDLGRLQYRAQKREYTYIPGQYTMQPCGQVNNPSPDNGEHIRAIEWIHMMPPDQAELCRGTVLTRETPFTPTNPDQYEYPFPDEANRQLYRQYRKRVSATERLLVCGRLGENKYFDQDQAIARALMLSRAILSSHP